MSRTIHFSMLLLLLIFAPCLYAQVGLIAPNLTAKSGAEVSVVIKVTNFTHLEGMQFTLAWDPAILSFKNTSDYNLPNLSDNSFGFQDTPQGLLRFQWVGDDLTLPDTAAIFKIHFKVIGAPASVSKLSFVTQPTDIEVINNDLKKVAFTLTDGIVKVADMSISNQEAANLLVSGVAIIPNPILREGIVKFDLKQKSSVMLKIFDIYGKKIYEISNICSIGTNFASLNIETFKNESGVYFYQLIAGQEFISGKIIFSRF